MPKLRQQTLETAIIERYRRREASIEESLIEMLIWPVFQFVVSKILPKPCGGTKVSPGTISNLNKKVFAKIEEWRGETFKGQTFIGDGVNLLERCGSVDLLEDPDSYKSCLKHTLKGN